MKDVSTILYLYKDKVLIPTSARTEAGYYVTTDQCEIIDSWSAHTLPEALKQALERVVARGNPLVPTPDWTKASPKPPFLEQAKAKSWREFEENSEHWLICVTDQRSEITPYRPREDRGFEEDLERKEILPGDLGIEGLAKRMAEIISKKMATQS